MAPAGSPCPRPRNPPRNQEAAGFGVPDAQKSSEKPGGRQVWIEHHRPVVQGDAAIEVAGEVGQRMPASRQRDRIIASKFDSPAGEARALGSLTLRIDLPSIDLAPEMTPRRRAI